VQTEKIAAIDSNISTDGAKKISDASNRYVFPGAINSHFHIGIYRPLAEDAASESTSAASGGVTTFLSYFRTGQDYLNKVGPYREILPELLELSDKSFLVDCLIRLSTSGRNQSRSRILLLEDQIFTLEPFRHTTVYLDFDGPGN
jgi:dihydroorotase-like cyclic amidohydrolase